MKTVFFVFVLVTIVVAFASAQDETDEDLLEFQDLIEEFKRGRGRGRSRNSDISASSNNPYKYPYMTTCHGQPFPVSSEGAQCLCLSRGPMCFKKTFVAPRPSRRRLCLKYNNPCKVNYIGAHDCCKGFGCYSPSGQNCKKGAQCKCLKYDQLSFLHNF